MYRVIHMFRDVADNGHIYRPGEQYPRDGFIVSAERLEELASCDNARGKALIQAAETPAGAVQSQDKEIPAEEQKPAQKPRQRRHRTKKE